MALGDNMRIRDLREYLANLSTDHDDDALQVWLPGSRIRIERGMFQPRPEGVVLIEGSVVPGSALDTEGLI